MFPQGIRYYRVRWKGFGEDEDTWEPEENLFDCKNVLDEYWEKSRKNKQTKVEKIDSKWFVSVIFSRTTTFWDLLSNHQLHITNNVPIHLKLTVIKKYLHFKQVCSASPPSL